MSAKNKILVTGGAGFIGSHLVDRLLGEGHEVISLDNFNSHYDPEIKRKNIQKHHSHDNFTLSETDIRNQKELSVLFKNNNIKKVVHLAARAGVRASIEAPHLYQDVNIRGTLNLLELSKNIDHFIFGSSSSVYGVNKNIPFKEHHTTHKPVSPYAASKRSCELFCHAYHNLYNIPITCLRFFTVYGPRQRPEMAIHKFTRLIDQGKPIQMYGDGSSERDYTYIDDIVSGILSSLNKPQSFEVFNLGNSQTTKLRELISLIEKNLGKEAKIKQLPSQPGDVPITYSDISKAKKILGYNPKTPIEEGIKKFVDWYKGV